MSNTNKMSEADNSEAISRAKLISKLTTEQLLREFHLVESRGQNKLALLIGRELVSRKPGMMQGHYAMGSALCNMGMLFEADAALKKAIVRDPNVAGIYGRHAEVLNRLGHRDLAVAAANKAVELAPKDPKMKVIKAVVLRLGGRADEAYAFLNQAIADGCDDPNLRSIRGSMGGQMGKLGEGIAELEALVKEADDRVWTDLFMHSAVLMHLSRLYDQAQRYQEAFEAAKRAGEMRTTGYDPQAKKAECDARIRAWSSEQIQTMACSRVKSEKPVFIVGMPRSGTSLIEQIIASHPLGYGGGEMGEAYMFARELSEPNAIMSDRKEIVSGLQRAALDRCGRKILKAMEKAAGKNEDGRVYERITDKLPSNYEYVGVIGKMLPGAKIIHCKRSALDTCVSCYLLDFVGDKNHGYSYDLKHLAHQYKLYEQHMAHWLEVSEIEILEVEYEDLVANPVDGAKRIIEYIGLEWDDRCARSHETVRAVSTLSSDQVRKPMYTSSVERWKNYEGWIGELIEGLRE